MTTTKGAANAATRAALEELLKGYGWKSKPIYPHIFYKEGVPYRYYFTDLGLRREGQHSKAVGGGWFRLRSGYYKNIIIQDGKIYGMKRQGM